MKRELKERLQQRLQENYTVFMEQLQGKTASELIAMAPEITAVQQLHEQLLIACNDDDTEFLLRFDNPLELVRGYWVSEITDSDFSEEIGHTLWEIRDKELYSKEQLTQHPKDTVEPLSPAAQGKKSKKKERNSHER